MKPKETDFNIGSGYIDLQGYADKLSVEYDKIEKDRDALLNAIKNVEKLCDGHNPDHAQIWGICYDELNSRKV